MVDRFLEGRKGRECFLKKENGKLRLVRSVEACLPAAFLRQREKGVYGWCCDTCHLPSFMDDGDQRIDFHGTVPFQVLQH